MITSQFISRIRVMLKADSNCRYQNIAICKQWSGRYVCNYYSYTVTFHVIFWQLRVILCWQKRRTIESGKPYRRCWFEAICCIWIYFAGIHKKYVLYLCLLIRFKVCDLVQICLYYCMRQQSRILVRYGQLWLFALISPTTLIHACEAAQ